MQKRNIIGGVTSFILSPFIWVAEGAKKITIYATN